MAKGKFSKKYVIITAVIAIAAAGGFGIYKYTNAQSTDMSFNSAPKKTVTVQKGNINFAVMGTGNLYYDRTSVVPSKVATTVTKVYFKEGDKVKAGDLLVELDDSDAVLAMNQKVNALTQSQIANAAAAAEISKLSIKPPFAGQISNVAVKKGDTVQKYSPLFTIADTSKLKVMVDFNLTDSSRISVNQMVDVNLTSIMQTVRGTVSYKSNKPASSSQGAQLCSIEVLIDNPGAITEGMPATVSLDTNSGTITSTNTGTLEYVNKTTVTSETTGTVEAVSIKKNQQVNTGEVVVKLKNDDVVRNKENGDLNVSNSQIAIQSTEKQLGYYKLYSPIDGTISKQTIKIGDNVNIGEIITTIKDTSIIQADIDVDELDIAKIALGQKVKVTVDALPETLTKPIEAEVLKIGIDGTTKTGVTTYPVTVRINERQDILKAGMNINAEIQVGSVSNVLYLPKKAITKSNGKSYVTILSGNSQTNSSVSTVRKEIEVGVGNNELVEVKSGIKEGDTVVFPEN